MYTDELSFMITWSNGDIHEKAFATACGVHARDENGNGFYEVRGYPEFCVNGIQINGSAFALRIEC